MVENKLKYDFLIEYFRIKIVLKTQFLPNLLKILGRNKHLFLFESSSEILSQDKIQDTK